MMVYPQRKSNLSWRLIAEQVVIIDLDGDRQFHELNETASYIWTLCDGKHSSIDIVKKVTDEFEVDPHEAQVDTNGLLQEFAQKNLLT